MNVSLTDNGIQKGSSSLEQAPQNHVVLAYKMEFNIRSSKFNRASVKMGMLELEGCFEISGNKFLVKSTGK